MTETTKSILVYISLIAFVAVIIIVILQIGSKIQAPASIGGQWQVIASTDELADCLQLTQSQPELFLQIQQSGPHLQIYFPADTKANLLDGHIEGFRFETKSSRDDQLFLQGNLNRAVQPNTISATLSGEGCQDPISFTGVRQAGSAVNTGGH